MHLTSHRFDVFPLPDSCAKKRSINQFTESLGLARFISIFIPFYGTLQCVIYWSVIPHHFSCTICCSTLHCQLGYALRLLSKIKNPTIFPI